MSTGQRRDLVPSSAKAVLCTPGAVCDEAPSVSALLTTRGRGAYTGARTVGRHSVFHWRFHVRRIAQSLRGMIDALHPDAAEHSDALLALTDEAQLRPRLDALAAFALREYAARFDGDEERKIVLLVTLEREPQLFCHVSALLDAPKIPTIVATVPAHRDNPTAKDTQWVEARLKYQVDPDVTELLLVNDGVVLEGSSSNFFAVKDGVVFTASTGMLPGSMQDVLATICPRLDVRIADEAPRIADAASWDEAFLTSTSRFVLPIGTIRLHEPAGAEIKLPSIALGSRLRQYIVDNAAEFSVRLV